MQALVNETSCIFDYFQIAGLHTPIIQFIAYHVQQVKKWSFHDVDAFQITPCKVGHSCLLIFKNGNREVFEVIDNNGKFRIGALA